MRILKPLLPCLIPNKAARYWTIARGVVENRSRLLRGWGNPCMHMTLIPAVWWIYRHVLNVQMHKFRHGRKISSRQTMAQCSVMRPVQDRAVGGAILKENGP